MIGIIAAFGTVAGVSLASEGDWKRAIGAWVIALALYAIAILWTPDSKVSENVS
jgi:hypothetical protein